MATLVPGVGFFNRGDMWEILPPPSPPNETPIIRSGIYLNIYETINPSVQITAIGNIACIGGTPLSPTQPSPELITAIKIEPGSAPGRSGTGVSVLIGPVGNISEMYMPEFREPFIEYNTIASAPVPTLILPAPLVGRISEKYLWDQEFGCSDLYGDVNTLTKRDNLESLDYYGGYKRKYRKFPERPVSIKKDLGTYRSVTLNQMYPKGFADAATRGSYAHDRVANTSSYIFNYKPSLIRRLRFFYTITVTSTCPPYTWTFPAYMDVDNNWTNHSKRVKYRVARQRGRFKP